jgi:hypothetical protein
MGLHNMAGMDTATAGTGTVTLGSALTGLQTFANAGVVNAEVVPYSIKDGVAWEVGIGTYTVAGTTLSRDTVYDSSDGGAKINLSGSGVEVRISFLAESVVDPLYVSYAKLADVQTNGTNGGSFTSGSYATRVLNTEIVDPDGIVTLSANQFTLTTGTYRILARAPGYKCGRHKAKLYNVTDAADEIVGEGTFSAAASGYATTSALVRGQFTILDTKTFELQHRCETTSATFGLGVACSFSDSEIYAVVEIWKLSG